MVLTGASVSRANSHSTKCSIGSSIVRGSYNRPISGLCTKWTSELSLTNSIELKIKEIHGDEPFSRSCQSLGNIRHEQLKNVQSL
jgi:hypothetical protein